MLEAKRDAVALEPQELVELEQTLADGGRDAAYLFLEDRLAVFRCVRDGIKARVEEFLTTSVSEGGGLR